MVVSLILGLFWTLTSKTSDSKLIKVVILDTGLDVEDPKYKFYLCKKGHEDFTGTGLKPHNSHGTLVVDNFIKNAKGSNFCLIILKYFDEYETKRTSLDYLLALEKATQLRPDIVNYSGGGNRYSSYENSLIEKNPQILFFVAAGNEGRNLDEQCAYYPACLGLPNIVVVGALSGEHKASYSNYGAIVTEWENGAVKDVDGDYVYGTSFATPIVAGRYVRGLNE